MTEIEFTDRYGGRAPSWLRACHAQCEAMGVVPMFQTICDDGSVLDPDNDSDPRLVQLWNAAHEGGHGPEAYAEACDGWHFVKCPDCNGSGRVSWAIAIARVPRWVWKGITFYRFAMQPEVSPPDWTWMQRFRNYLNAAFLHELKAIRR